jgi:hypothetical protein
VTRRPDPFTQALDDLRARSEAGAFAPGRPIVIIDEARRLRLSTTPVREALAWLYGYGLIERAPVGGYVAPRLDAESVRSRLAFRLHCLILGLSGPGRSLARGDTGGESGPAPVRLLERMLRAVKETGNAALVDAYVRVTRQLAPLAAAEARLFNDVETEAADLLARFEARLDGDLVEAVNAYHQRRIAAAPLLVLELEERRSQEDRP